MRTMAWMLIGACAVALVPIESAAARHGHHRRQVLRVVPPRPVPPSQDAIELATLAPPSPLSTIEQTYGDAAFARRRAARQGERELAADHADTSAAGGAPYPCEPRVAGTSAYICNGAPHERGYGQGYAFTPDYLSAPQRLGVAPDEQTSVLPPITGLAWVVDSFRYDRHN